MDDHVEFKIIDIRDSLRQIATDVGKIKRDVEGGVSKIGDPTKDYDEEELRKNVKKITENMEIIKNVVATLNILLNIVLFVGGILGFYIIFMFIKGLFT